MMGMDALRHLRRILPAVLAWLTLATAQAATLPEGARVLRDQAYGSASRQRFDAWLPASPSGPVLFLVSEGGDKAAAGVADAKAQHWLARGYVLVSVNHRTRPQATVAQQLDDIGRALARAQAGAALWGADPARFVLMGQGAGAHLVALLNTAPAPALAAGAKPWRAAVSLANPAFWPAQQLSATLSPPLLMVCSRLQQGACDQALDFERRASVFRQHITIWQQALTPREVGTRLGLPGAYTGSVTAWINGMAGR
jgi:arylformamidase